MNNVTIDGKIRIIENYHLISNEYVFWIGIIVGIIFTNMVWWIILRNKGE